MMFSIQRPDAMAPETVAADADLGELFLYSLLSERDLRALAERTVFRRFAAGEAVFQEGDPPSTFHVIVRGRVKVTKCKPTGREVILAVFGPDDPLGAACLLEDRAYPATAIALGEVVCAETAREDLLGLLAQSPEMNHALLIAMSRRLVQLTRRFAELSATTVERRLARLFVRLADGCGRPENGVVLIPVPLSRADLADLVGTSVETCSRVMSRWRAAGTLSGGATGFLVHDRARLDRLSQGD